jgi:hypothetical protein
MTCNLTQLEALLSEAEILECKALKWFGPQGILESLATVLATCTLPSLKGRRPPQTILQLPGSRVIRNWRVLG